MSDFVWVEEKNDVVTWVSNNAEDAARHNINPGCLAKKFVAEWYVEKLERELAAAREDADNLEDTLARIQQWCKAYPLDVFPEPDFKKAAELLKAGGMTIDTISASNMRHVLKGIQAIIDAAQEKK